VVIKEVLTDLIASFTTFDKQALNVKGSHQLLFYADDANLMGENIKTTKKKQKRC
jgi:hypothetical protein